MIPNSFQQGRHSHLGEPQTRAASRPLGAAPAPPFGRDQHHGGHACLDLKEHRARGLPSGPLKQRSRMPAAGVTANRPSRRFRRAAWPWPHTRIQEKLSRASPCGSRDRRDARERPSVGLGGSRAQHALDGRPVPTTKRRAVQDGCVAARARHGSIETQCLLHKPTAGASTRPHTGSDFHPRCMPARSVAPW